MRRRKLAWIGGLLCLIAAGLLFAWLQMGGRLNVDGFSQIEPGMTQAEVEALLGGPPGNYGRYSGKFGEMTQEAYLAPPGSVEKIWCNDERRFEIYFDQEGRVVGKHKRAGYQQRFPRSWREVRAWVGW